MKIAELIFETLPNEKQFTLFSRQCDRLALQCNKLRDKVSISGSCIQHSVLSRQPSSKDNKAKSNTSCKHNHKQVYEFY